MQLLLIKSDSHRDLQCPICAQFFRVYWEQTSAAQQETMRAIILDELREHHSHGNGGNKTTSAHPSGPFNLPNEGSLSQFSGAALLSSLSGIPPVLAEEPLRSSRESQFGVDLHGPSRLRTTI
jgi:hypothetical protein